MRLKAAYHGINPGSVSGAPIRKRIEDALRHLSAFRGQS
jgi:hypothetical protein